MLDSRSVPTAVVRYPRPGSEGPAGLFTRWSTGEEIFLDAKSLRLHCPCATCNELRGKSQHEKPLTPRRASLQVIQSSAEEETRLEQVWPIGNYAIGLRWGDKHDTGIYSFEVLREIAAAIQSKPR